SGTLYHSVTRYATVATVIRANVAQPGTFVNRPFVYSPIMSRRLLRRMSIHRSGGALFVEPDAVAVCDGTPVHYLPPRRDVVGAAVLVAEVIGVLPDIQAEDRAAADHEWGVLIGGGFDGKRSVGLDDEPDPAAAEQGRGGGRKLLFELVA